MNIGSLRNRVEVLKFVESKDSFGAATGEWIPFKSVWADIQTKTGKEQMTDRQVKAEINADIVTRYTSDITSKNRIKHNDSVYEILAAINEDMKCVTLKLICKEVL